VEIRGILGLTVLAGGGIIGLRAFMEKNLGLTNPVEGAIISKRAAVEA
jgi:hypothetical protein